MKSSQNDAKAIERLRRRLKNGWRLLVDPAGWSADWYRKSNKMFYSATMPETWRKREDIRLPEDVEQANREQKTD